NLQDAMRVREALTTASRVSLLGAGYVGLELAECLHARGKTVLMFERESQVLPSIDGDMAQIIEYELRRFGVQLCLNANVQALVGDNGSVNGIKTATGLGVTPTDMVILDTGVEPNVGLATDAGIHLGVNGGISVDAHMETNVPGVYSAGNCVEMTCPIR